MKNRLFKYAFIGFLVSTITILSTKTFGQITFDDEDNFYELTTYWDNYYDSLINKHGAENIEGAGLNLYKYWKAKWEPRVQPTGDFLPYLQGIENSWDCFDNIGYFDINGTWDEVGPVTSSDQGTDDVGRLSCLEIDPANDSIVLCGSPEGGLYYTKNKGENWINAGLDRPKEEHELNMFTPGIASIIISHYNDTTYWIVATGDKDHTFSKSKGVLRTIDEGETWFLINGAGNNSLPNGSYYIRKLLQHPDYPNIIFAATTRGLYKTTNALAQNPEDVIWTKILDDPNSSDEGFFDIEYHKTDYDTMFLSREYRVKNTINGSELLWSINGGDDWTAMPNVDSVLPIDERYGFFLSLLELTDANSNILYAYIKGKNPDDTLLPTYYNKICKYNIGTQQWIVLNDSPPFSNGNGRNGFAVSPNSEDTLFCATVNTYFSSDGGINWTMDNNWDSINGYYKKMPHSDIQDLKFNKSGTEIWAASDGGPFIKNITQQEPKWINKVNNIGIAFIYNFDNSKIDPNYYVFGGLDVHSQLYNKSSGIWTDKTGQGDGAGCAFDNEEVGTLYATNSRYICRTTNWTEEDCNLVGSNWTRKVKVHPGDHNTIYMSLGDSMVRSYNQGSDWETLVTLDDLNTNDTLHLLYDMHVAQGNDNYLYLRLVKQPSASNPLIYKSTNVNETDPSLIYWGEPLIPTLNTKGWINNIVVDYENPDRIWVSYSSYTGTEIWEYDGTNWTDITFNLISTECNYGISSLEHLHGTDRGLFAGGLHGLFYLEDESETWKLYKPGIPYTGGKQVLINYCSGKIVAGTVGRGIWETSLPAGWDSPPVITENETWEGYRVVMNPVVVPAGVTLTIKGKVTFTPYAKIIVERGAKLILDGGTLTNTCGGLWKGIEVWGSPIQPQSYTYQGSVKIINGGTIENAICGIHTIRFSVPDGEVEESPDYNYTGGMVLVDGGIFKNNSTAVKFWPYDHEASKSFLRDCQFITNDDLLDGTDPGYFIEMSDISGIKISGCNFTDEHSYTNPDELTSGIEAHNARFTVFPNYDQLCVFERLYDGIRAYSHNPTRTVTIENSIFDNNLRSVYLSSVMEATFTGNELIPWEINVPLGEQSYCLYLDYCKDFTVEDNFFGFDFSGPFGSPVVGIGLIINNSGHSNNEIYNNTFRNIEYGTLAQNCNRGVDPDIGLQIKCNDYELNDHDIAVTAYLQQYNPGIAKNQGAPGETDMQAGNRFSLEDNGIDYSDYSTIQDGPITYYHHDPDMSLEPRIEPEYISKHITLDKQPTFYYKEQSCPSNQSGGGSGGSGGLRGDMSKSQYKADSTNAILTALIDGGDTEVLEQQVLQSMPPETYDLYMSLMGKSPYLSDSVLIAAIEKENVLSNVLIKDILVANPQSAKSNEVMEKVDEKTNPFNEDLLAEVLLGQYIVAAKEKLEAILAYYRHQRSTSLKYLKQLYRHDTVNSWAHDSLIYLLENENGLNEKYELVFEYIGMNNWTEANNLLNNIASLYSMNQQQQEIYQDVQQFSGVLFELHQLDSTIFNMPETLKTTLYSLADNSQNFASNMARNILIKVNDYDYTEPVIFPEAGLKSGNIIFDLPDVKKFTPEHVKIYPNPALDYIIIELNTGNLTGASVNLFDSQGKPVRNVNIPAYQQNYVLGLIDIPPGIYVLKVDSNGKNIGSKTFSIVK